MGKYPDEEVAIKPMMKFFRIFVMYMSVVSSGTLWSLAVRHPLRSEFSV